LGGTDFIGEFNPIEINEEGVFLKMYNKKISKPLRKLGHINLVGINGESIDVLSKKLNELKQKIIVKSSN
jgi:5-(carboxyamino)imidazole ribonucleotide synthase